MKNLIYQYWDGEIPEGALAGSANMKAYAERIGAEYLFEDNPRFCTAFCFPLNEFFGAYKPVYDDKFLEYDNVLYVDTDIFAVSGLEENIFDDLTADVGICTEPFQPTYRQRRDVNWINSENDEKWVKAVNRIVDGEFPRTDAGLLKVYNAGMVLWSNRGLRMAREKFLSYATYVTYMFGTGLPTFYAHDQNWLHANLVTQADYCEMSNDWNTIVHFYRDGKDNNLLNDPRTDSTKFVHIMLTGESRFDALALWRITNLPSSVWRYKKPPYWKEPPVYSDREKNGQSTS
ncbi:hypothetical protein LCGC14_1715280 [marine sediment metagenome]|uniref:Nucleotide-diphospho-sugar transferase domain-containing protein n=1 Tax=marine sediment metagenome TaxID=412755 RepID=A0A0F9JUK6_9ZZZZ